MLTEKQLEAYYDSLTDDEKIGELLQLSISFFGVDCMVTGENSTFPKEVIEHAGTLISNAKTGSVKNRAIQEEHLKHSKVPLLFMGDIISGFAVALPFPLAQAGTFDPDYVKKLARETAKAATATGMNVTFSPMVDIGRDARWGRNLEGYGEDTLLTCRMAKAVVEGYQGENPDDPDSLSACVKHFAVYGYGEAGRDYNNVELSERALKETYLPPYKAAVDAGCHMVMSSFNTIGGVPVTIDPKYMRDLLRDEWGFDGVTITDWCALCQCRNHRAAENDEDLALMGLESTVDICMMDPLYTRHALALVKSGRLSPDIFKETVMRCLRLKNKKGILEDPYRYLKGDRTIDMDAHYKMATEAVEKTCVLLENAENILPLKPKQTVALIGPYAVKKRASAMWNRTTLMEDEDRKFPVDAFRNVYDGTVLCEQGCGALPADHFMMQNTDEVFISPEDPVAAEKAAIEAAKKADTVVMMVGEHLLQSGESASRADIVVPDIQMDLFRKIYAVNQNIVAVVFAGRPLDLREVKKLSKAILFAWMPGDATSDGLANLLCGKAVPSAKLAMSMPYHVAQCPLHYDLYPTGHPSKGMDHRFSSRYVDVPNKPLYPFGYGLSYTTFTYSDITASAETMTAENPLTLSVTVTNDGDFDGEEIVQLYLWDMEANRVSRPLRELKDFKRVALKKGESKTVTFEITEEMLRYLNYDGEVKAEAGRFTAFVGESAATDRKVIFRFQ